MYAGPDLALILLHRVGRPVGLQGPGQIRLDLAPRLVTFFPGQLDAHTGGARALVARVDPDHLARHRNALGIIHQCQQHEHFFAQACTGG
jgi:hypothetical protein